MSPTPYAFKLFFLYGPRFDGFGAFASIKMCQVANSIVIYSAGIYSYEIMSNQNGASNGRTQS